MITTCTECQARYQLDADKIPPRVIKVRCPSCSGVFSLDGTQARKEAAEAKEQPLAVQGGFEDYTSSAARQPAADQPAVDQPMTDRPVVDKPFATETAAEESVPVEKPADPEPSYRAAPAAAVEPASPSVEPAASSSEPVAEVAVMDRPAERPSRRRRSKEEMLARALVSDIMVYNRDLYDQAKADGNLLEALGSEIKKSWELYKEKVTPEVANSSNYFRDALNEILADGENIF